MRNEIIKKTFVISFILIIFNSAFSNFYVIAENKFDENINLFFRKIDYLINESKLDLKYVYNITNALSNIIYTEYNESKGDLAKGRFYGSIGEHRAAEILYENMSILGLNPELEQVNNTPKKDENTHLIQIVDYNLKINDEQVKDYHIVPSYLGPRDDPNRIDYNFSFNDLKIKRFPKNPITWALNYAKSENKEDFAFIELNAAFYPHDQPFLKRLFFKYFNPLRYIGIPLLFDKSKEKIVLNILYKILPEWKATIGYDLNDDCYNMGASKEVLPYIYINGSISNRIYSDPEKYTVDFYIEQFYNKSIESNNVVGMLEGNDTSKTVIIDCLYDSWWCQGTGDSAIGMALVLGIAKYFVDNNIKPKYNLKFIGFAGEEVGLRGAYSYEYEHSNENIIYVIDLNQLGFSQEKPNLYLNIISNKLTLLNEIWKIAIKTDYKHRVNNSDGLRPLWMPIGAPSDDRVFATERLMCKTVCFLKGYYWKLHHRDGLDHFEGDTMKYYDWEDVSATGEIILNIVKYLTLEK